MKAKKAAYKWSMALFLALGFVIVGAVYGNEDVHKKVSHHLDASPSLQQKPSDQIVVWNAQQAANQENIVSVSVSPDGKYTLVETKLPSLPAQGSQSKLMLVENASSKVIWQTEPEHFLFPQWSPKGDQITFLVSDTKETQLIIGTPANWKPTQLLVTNEDVKGYKWAPDGKKIVVISTIASYKEENKRSFTVDNQTHSIKFSFVSLSKTFKEKGINLKEYVFPDFKEIEKVIAWSPDSKNLAFSVFSEDEK